MSAAAPSGAKRHSLERSALETSASEKSASEKSASTSEESDRLEAAADQAIAACNGDMRSAIRALILANEYLEYELCDMFAAVSKGYARGRVKRKRGDTEVQEKPGEKDNAD